MKVNLQLIYTLNQQTLTNTCQPSLCTKDIPYINLPESELFYPKRKRVWGSLKWYTHINSKKAFRKRRPSQEALNINSEKFQVTQDFSRTSNKNVLTSNNQKVWKTCQFVLPYLKQTVHNVVVGPVRTCAANVAGKIQLSSTFNIKNSGKSYDIFSV